MASKLVRWMVAGALLGAACESVGPGGSNGGGDGGVPMAGDCERTDDWDPMAAQYEREVLELVNAARARGADCGSAGSFAPTHALRMEARLLCAARLHSAYMAENDDFAHETRAGLDPFERMQAVGYSFSAAGENIAVASSTPEEAVDGWLGSDGHCANLMSPDFTDTGVGYAFGRWSQATWADGMAAYWTQKFGREL